MPFWDNLKNKMHEINHMPENIGKTQLPPTGPDLAPAHMNHQMDRMRGLYHEDGEGNIKPSHITDNLHDPNEFKRDLG